MTEKYIVVSDDEYCYTLDTQAEGYRTLEDFEKEEFENAKKENVDIKEYEDAILEFASDKYWEWVYDNFLEPDTVNDIMNALVEENKELKFQVQDKQLGISLYDADNTQLMEENKQLKSSIDKLCTEITEKNMTTTEIQVKLMNILDKVD